MPLKNTPGSKVIKRSSRSSNPSEPNKRKKSRREKLSPWLKMLSIRIMQLEWRSEMKNGSKRKPNS